jgi:hypothetical protein
VGCCFGDNVEKVEEYLVERIIHRTEKQTEKNAGIIRQFERKAQAMQILHFLMK